MHIFTKDSNIIKADVLEDNTGEWGLYICVLDGTQETVLTKAELEEALAAMAAMAD